LPVLETGPHLGVVLVPCYLRMCSAPTTGRP